MFFIKSALEALETPGRPFIHDVNATARMGARKPFAKAIAPPPQPGCAESYER